MKFSCLFSLLIFLQLNTSAQQIKKEELRMLKSKEDSMTKNAIEILQGENTSDRFTADSIFTKMLVRALKTKNSFYYPFDSLFTISKLYSPDSSFKIFTWQLMIDENKTWQHGAIQMKTEDGSLKLIPLFDKSDFIENIEDTIGNNFSWIGAVYYKIVLNKRNNENYYTLLGYDENDIRSNRKIIELLHFENAVPIFGGKYFSVPDDNIKPKNHARFIMEYKKEAGPRLTYDDELGMIIMEHLISPSNEPNKKFTLIGDGDYEGFKWLNGKWIYISKVFNEVTPEGNTPIPNPIRDDNGNINDQKLKGRELDRKN